MGLLKNIARIARALEVKNELDYWRCTVAVNDYNSPQALKLKQIRQLMYGKKPTANQEVKDSKNAFFP